MRRFPPPVDETANRAVTVPPIGPADRMAASPASADDREPMARCYLAISAMAFALVFGLVWIYTAVMPMAFLTRDYPAWIAKRSMLSSCELGSASFFGDSRAMAGIDPRELPFPSSNFALSGSSPIEAYFAVKRALLCARRPKVVVIGYSAGKFVDDADFWNISTRVGILTFADMRDVQRQSQLLDDEIQALRRSDHLAPVVRAALFALHFPPFYFDSLVNGYIAGRYVHNRAEERQIRADRGHALFGTGPGSDAVASEAAMPAFVVSPLINAYFTATLSALARDKIPVVLLSLPIDEATCKLMNPAIRAGLARYLERAAAAYPGTRMAGPTIPCLPDRLFGDAFHLNAAGAAAYGRLVAHWLKPEIPPVAGSLRVLAR